MNKGGTNHIIKVNGKNLWVLLSMRMVILFYDFEKMTKSVPRKEEKPAEYRSPQKDSKAVEKTVCVVCHQDTAENK